jgi:Flp pilus assembly pilin Flp
MTDPTQHPLIGERMRLLRNFSSDDSGNSAIEYALITSLVSIAIIAGISSIHQSLVTTLQAVAEPQRAQMGYVAAASLHEAPGEARGPVGVSLTDKLADLREKENQGLALGRDLGNGPGKDKEKKEKKKDKKKKKTKKDK